MDAVNAIMLIEGDVDATEDEIIAAFQSLIDSGVVWNLQGSYGRAAHALIEAGHCTRKEG
jgi:hypothetical protein